MPASDPSEENASIPTLCSYEVAGQKGILFLSQPFTKLVYALKYKFILQIISRLLLFHPVTQSGLLENNIRLVVSFLNHSTVSDIPFFTIILQ